MRNLFIGTILAASLSWATVGASQELTDLAEIQLVIEKLEQRVNALEDENLQLRQLLDEESDLASPPTDSLDATLGADDLAASFAPPDLETELRLRELEEKTAAIEVSNDGRELTFNGVNVHIVDDTGSTICSSDGCNGLGNLIIGYDEVDSDTQKSGSHNLVMGTQNSYTSAGGIVTGERNGIHGQYAVVTGGDSNMALGYSAFIATGSDNLVTGNHNAILGGSDNKNQGFWSSILGGVGNTIPFGGLGATEWQDSPK